MQQNVVSRGGCAKARLRLSKAPHMQVQVRFAMSFRAICDHTYRSHTPRGVRSFWGISLY